MKELEPFPDERIDSYIEGFDERIQGGIPKDQIILVSGPCGSMKTSIVFNILYHSARDGKRGLYLTLEQNKRSLLSSMAGLGMRLGEVQENFVVVDLGSLRRSKWGVRIDEKINWFETIISQVKNIKESSGLDLLVLDSLDALYLISRIDEPREQVFQFFEHLREMDITTFIISEVINKSETHGKYGFEGFLADGILQLAFHMVNDVDTELRFRCIKMRNTEHSRSFFTLLYKDGKFQITEAIID